MSKTTIDEARGKTIFHIEFHDDNNIMRIIFDDDSYFEVYAEDSWSGPFINFYI